jgi:ribosomal protein S18 acetylase RimI-like enzyme
MEATGIRPLEKQDLSACAGVIRESFRTVAEAYGLDERNCPGHPAFIGEERLLSMVEKGARFFGIYTDGRLIGCVAVEVRGNIAFIEKLAVLPGFRHRGFGRRLIEAAIRYAGEKGCLRASVGIMDENRRLKNWYIGLGFHVTELKEYVHLPFTVCMMERRL